MLQTFTRNDFIYGELGRISFKSVQMYNVINYWIKNIHCNEDKGIAKA